MPSCVRKMLVSCLGGILVACLGMEAFCCFEVMVASCWLCHFGSRLAVELPWDFPVAF